MFTLSGDRPFDLSAVVTAAATLCGESIAIEDERQPRGRYGMCARPRDGGHVIYVDPGLAGDLYFHTVLHELGHSLLGHNDATYASSPDRLTGLVTGAQELTPASCVVPHFREWAQRETDAEQFASTMARRLRRGLTNRHLSRLDEAFG